MMIVIILSFCGTLLLLLVLFLFLFCCTEIQKLGVYRMILYKAKTT